MSRLEFTAPKKSSKLLEDIYKSFGNRIESSPPDLCPVDLTRAFLELCHAQTCGKCVPCRIGLKQLIKLLNDILEGNATMNTLDFMTDLARSIYESADCAIGYEAGLLAYNSLIDFRDDYEEHIQHGHCICNYEKPTPCTFQCPAHVDVPGYVALVKEGRYEDAMQLIRKDNPFPTTCAYICEHPCEKNCRRNMVDTAVNIRGLKKVASENAKDVLAIVTNEPTGKKIAIIGGGPGGLSTAYFLQLMGHQVTVFEMRDGLGGMLRYGIPNYRLPKDQLDRDIAHILSTGIEVVHGKRIGVDLNLTDLQNDYDATIITIGASSEKKLGIENEDAKGIVSAIKILRAVGDGDYPDLKGRDVCIVGGGNVAMDACRTAVRLGANAVNVVYRRRVADMTALPSEIHGAVAEGVNILPLMAPSRVVTDENGAVCGLAVKPQMTTTLNKGRANVQDSGEDEYVIPCSLIITAIGQNIETAYFEKFGLPANRGRFTTNKWGGFDELPGVFAGGDCSSGPKTVVSAIGHAKVLASNIDAYLGFDHKISCDIDIPLATTEDRLPTARVELAERDNHVRKHDWDGVELSMSHAEACQEAGRCLRCDHFGYGIFKGGREKSW